MSEKGDGDDEGRGEDRGGGREGDVEGAGLGGHFSPVNLCCGVVWCGVEWGSWCQVGWNGQGCVWS